MIDPQLLEIAGLIAAAGVAWGGARAGAQSVATELREMKKDFALHCSADAKMGERVASVETLVQAIHGKVVLARREVDKQ